MAAYPAVQTSTFVPNPAKLTDATLLDLRKRMRGRIVTPQDADYAFMCVDGVFNKLQTNKPAAFLQPVGTADVSAILKYCSQKGLEFTVSGGRHTMRCFKEGVLCIDLRLMRSVIVDKKNRVGHVQGGAKLADFDAECNAQGLVAVAGSDPRTGVGGYLQGGGWGWLSRRYGMACDNVVEVDVRLYDLPKCVIAGFQLYTEDKAKACLRAVRDHVKASPREVATMFELNWSPPNKKTGVRRPFAQILPIYLGDSEKEGMEMLKDVMTAVPDPFVKNVGKLPYSTLQSMLVQHIPPSFRTETAVFVPDMPEELIDILIEQFNKSPLPGTFLACFAFGGAIGDKEPGDTAFPWRLKNGHWITCLASAQNIEDHKKMEGWVAETGSKIIKFATGSFVNRIGNASTSDSSYERSVDYFGQNAKRLLELKKRYDPKNAFRNSDSGALLAGEVMAEEKASL